MSNLSVEQQQILDDFPRRFLESAIPVRVAFPPVVPAYPNLDGQATLNGGSFPGSTGEWFLLDPRLRWVGPIGVELDPETWDGSPVELWFHEVPEEDRGPNYRLRPTPPVPLTIESDVSVVIERISTGA